MVESTLRYRSRTELAVAALMEMIISQRLAPGDFLPSEAVLCQRFDMSRSTVRLALRTLETRGLVETRHGVGVRVTDRTRQAVTDSIELMLLREEATPQDMLEVRLALEGQAASLAAQRATDDDIQALIETIEVMRHPARTIDQIVEADLTFHLRVAETSRNNVLVALVHAIRGLLRDTIASTYLVSDRTEERLRDHSHILEAIASHDVVVAEAAMRDHLHQTERLIEWSRVGGGTREQRHKCFEQ